jgi:hypothetical protein
MFDSVRWWLAYQGYRCTLTTASIGTGELLAAQVVPGSGQALVHSHSRPIHWFVARCVLFPTNKTPKMTQPTHHNICTPGTLIHPKSCAISGCIGYARRSHARQIHGLVPAVHSSAAAW